MDAGQASGERSLEAHRDAVVHRRPRLISIRGLGRGQPLAGIVRIMEAEIPAIGLGRGFPEFGLPGVMLLDNRRLLLQGG